MKWLAILAALLPVTASAELSASVFLGKRALEKQPFERGISAGYRLPLSDAWFVKPEVGGWLGGRGSSSWFVGAPVGLQVWIPNTGACASVAVGPSYISNPDEVLGGHYQFDVEFGIGLKTEAANIGLLWKHFSSAGLEMPNLGRDLLGVQIGVKL